MARTTGTRFWRTAPGNAALAALALTACAPDEDPAEFEDAEAASQTEEETEDQSGDDTDTEPSEGETESERSEADSGAEPDAESTEDPTDETTAENDGPVNPDDAVETITYALPTGRIDGTMTVGLHHLRTNGETMELLLTYTPEFDEHEQYSLWELHGMDHAQVAPSLYDRENLKRYSLLRVGGGWSVRNVWATDHNTVNLASGDTQAYWANFPAPEDDIDTLNVGIPNAPEFEDVEIEGGQSTGDDVNGHGEDE